MNCPASTEVSLRGSVGQISDERKPEEQIPEEKTPKAEMPENPWGTGLHSQPTADYSASLNRNANDSRHIMEPIDANKALTTGTSRQSEDRLTNLPSSLPAWTKQLILHWIFHTFRRVWTPSVLPRFLVAISVISAIAGLLLTPSGITCAVIPYSHSLPVCRQTSVILTPTIQLYRSDIPLKRRGLGAVVFNNNDLSYEHARTIQDVEMSARDLSARVSLSSLYNRWMLKAHIDSFVDSAMKTHIALLELDAEFASAMRYLPMLDHQLLHSLKQFEQKTSANVISTALFTFLGLDQNNRKDLVDQSFSHDPDYREPKKAVQQYVSSLDDIFLGLITGSLITNGQIDRTTRANRLVHDMANRLRDIAKEADISERELTSKGASILTALRVKLGLNQNRERDYQRNLKVLSQVNALEKEWKAYYSSLLSALRSGQVDLKRIKGDLRLWFSDHSQRSLIEYAMRALRRSLEQVAKVPVKKRARIDPSPSKYAIRK
ncbi:hypothetical protein FRC17_006829 [Serendipita sp. 399]|nr:hypothetical protein FRC17_006829 [Serendipita sp. 399]